ncbi:hypothetical protein OBBRIDRAFT_703583, partial [Obba rivulosa]
KIVELKALINTGVQTNLIHPDIVKKYALPTVRLPSPIRARNVDGTLNQQGSISHRVEVIYRLKDLEIPTNFYVTGIGNEDLILGLPWLKRMNPKIDWETSSFTFSRKR